MALSVLERVLLLLLLGSLLPLLDFSAPIASSQDRLSVKVKKKTSRPVDDLLSKGDRDPAGPFVLRVWHRVGAGSAARRSAGALEGDVFSSGACRWP